MLTCRWYKRFILGGSAGSPYGVGQPGIRAGTSAQCGSAPKLWESEVDPFQQAQYANTSTSTSSNHRQVGVRWMSPAAAPLRDEVYPPPPSTCPQTLRHALTPGKRELARRSLWPEA